MILCWTLVKNCFLHWQWWPPHTSEKFSKETSNIMQMIFITKVCYVFIYFQSILHAISCLSRKLTQYLNLQLTCYLKENVSSRIHWKFCKKCLILNFDKMKEYIIGFLCCVSFAVRVNIKANWKTHSFWTRKTNFIYIQTHISMKRLNYKINMPEYELMHVQAWIFNFNVKSK